MKIELTVGCVYNDLTVDGIDLEGLSKLQCMEVIDHLSQWLKENPAKLKDVLSELITTHCSSFDYSEKPCECCGDHVCNYTWDI